MKKSLLTACVLLAVSAHAFANAADVGPQETAQSKGAGRIIGRVRVEGRFEKPAPLKVYKNRDFCGATVPNESLLVSREGGVRNAVIIVPKARQDKSAVQSGSLLLDNKNCAFVPHVQVAPAGSEILLLNSDPILHDVHARIGSETLFNVGLPTWRRVKKRLTRAGIVKIECDVLHTWMSAYVVVTTSPYFAVTNEKGEFFIEGAPPGSYEVDVWHETLGRQSGRVSLQQGRTAGVNVVYRVPDRKKN